MSHRTQFARAAVLAAGLIAGAAASAQDQSVEVRGPAVRTDVRALCPAIDTDLNDALVRAVQQVATAAVMDVRFELRGSRVEGVQTGAGPLAYQRALKRAVRGLECDSGQSTPQTVAMRVRFVDPFDRSATRAVALVEGTTGAR